MGTGQTLRGHRETQHGHWESQSWTPGSPWLAPGSLLAPQEGFVSSAQNRTHRGHRAAPLWARGSTPVGTGKHPRGHREAPPSPPGGFHEQCSKRNPPRAPSSRSVGTGKAPTGTGHPLFSQEGFTSSAQTKPRRGTGTTRAPPRSPGGTPESPPMLPEPPGSSQRDDGPGQVRPWGCPSGWTRARDSVPPRAGNSGGSGPAKVPCPPSLAPTPTPVPAATPAPAVPAAPAPAVPAVNSQRDRSHPGAAAAS